MSVQFGRWNYRSAPPAPDYLEKASQLLAPYGPDGSGRYAGPGVDIIYRGFHTTKESRRETQPHAAPSGAVIAWDGRLDNREELIRQLSGGLSLESTDVAIVAAAYEKWGSDGFGKLVGDWALAIWNPEDRSLILAKDFVGTRHLYYAIEKDQVTWSSILDPLVLLAGKQFALEEEYIAGWLAFFPATHLTPYVGIQAVPPSSFVRITSGEQRVRKYWDFDPGKRIRYRTDAEYEEHFRSVFAESVKRRLRSDTPVLAELSGGMDSSSIVCMADRILAQGRAETPRLDTVSYYDDSEPNWNERPYFSIVENKRGQAGFHIDFSAHDLLKLKREHGRFAATPASNYSSKAGQEFAACVATRGNRVLLSGIGGDEVTGGIPMSVPELADLLARARFEKFGSKLKVWAINQKKPWPYLFSLTLRKFLPPMVLGEPGGNRPPQWLCHKYARTYHGALRGYPRRLKLLGPLPSFQENLLTLDALRRQLGCSAPLAEVLCETRYPFLDRDLLGFLYAIPVSQLLRPGRRRSLMRWALSGIVPGEVLNRRRKAFVARQSIASIGNNSSELFAQTQSMFLAHFGIVNSRALTRAIEAARHGDGFPVVQMTRTFLLETWVRNMATYNILSATADNATGMGRPALPPSFAA